MICCISPASSNFDESLNALKYANRVSTNQEIFKIKLYTKVLEKLGAYLKLITMCLCVGNCEVSVELNLKC